VIDIKHILDQHGIPNWTEGKNVAPGWINIQCPFCDDSSNHFGFNPKKEYGSCWKCGHHFLDDTFQQLLSITKHEAVKLIEENKTNDLISAYNRRKRIHRNSTLELPKGSGELKKMHKVYLQNRNFDPEKIEKEYHITGTKMLGEYNYRIIIPIFVNGKLVSYQGRDITGKSDTRYKACQPEDEVICHKDIVYNADRVQQRKGIIVEGVTDVWRIGAGAVATFGTSYTNAQIKFIIKILDLAFLLFDPSDPIAQKKAEKLAFTLSGLKIKTELIEISDFSGDDPGSMSDEEAKYLRKNLLNY